MPLRPLFSAMVSPPMRMSPESGTSSMLMQRSMVDLPEPEAPRIEMTSPSLALSETPLSTSSEPKLLRRSRTEMAGAASEEAGTDDKDATPLDMGGLQTRLDGRGAAQMRREPPFDGHDDARDDEVENEVDQSRNDKDLDGAERLRDEFRGKPGHFHHRDDGSQRRGLHHENDLAAVSGEGLTDRDGEDDAAEEQEARHTAGPRRLNLVVRHRLQAATHDLAGIGCGVEGEGQHCAPVR